ncbi:MAG: hypothetical protein ACKVK6_00970 [bacterium]
MISSALWKLGATGLRSVLFLTVLATMLSVSLVVPLHAFASEDGDAIRDVFRAYRTAILEGKGEDAADLLCQSTLDYFDRMRILALDGDAAAVQATALVDQMQTMLFRLSVPAKTLETLSAKGLIAYSVEQGWIGKKSVQKVTPGKVQTEKDGALLHVNVDGEDAGPAFRFYREAKGWRLDLVPTLKATDGVLRSTALRAGVPHNEYILKVMSLALDTEIGDEAWEPLRGKTGTE